MKIFVEDQRLENLLKQYWPKDFFYSENEAEILIKDSEIIHKKTIRTWPIVKPIMLSKIINILENANELIINLKNGQFYPRRRIYKTAADIKNLTEKETEILSYLINNPGEVNKAKLLRDVWGYSSNIDTKTLETHLYNIRSKIGDLY